MLSVLKRWLGRSGPSPVQGERDPLGPAGERVAVKHLKKHGYRVLGVNVRTRVGEADIVAEAPDRRTIVVVEVKSRRVRADPFAPNVGPSAPPPPSDPPVLPARPLRPPPEASVHRTKQKKLVAILRHLGRANRWRNRPLRIDVIAVEFKDDGTHELRHHAGAVVARRAS